MCTKTPNTNHVNISIEKNTTTSLIGHQPIVVHTPPLLSDGMGWSLKKRLAFDITDRDFDLKSCLIKLKFNHPNKKNSLFTIEKEPEDPTKPTLKFFLSLIILSEAIMPWQILSLSAQDNVPVFNLFSEHFSKVTQFFNSLFEKGKHVSPVLKNPIFFFIPWNLLSLFKLFQNMEFSQHFRSEVASIYAQSWIGLYYGFAPHISNDNIVSFMNSLTQQTIYTGVKRFYVNVWFPNTEIQTFFFPPHIWNTKVKSNLFPNELVYRVSDLSGTPHGMITDGYPYAKSPYYKSPYFLTFKTDHSVPSNFLTFNTFQIPNSYGRILSMLTYNDDIDKFVSVFNTDIYLPYQKNLPLNSVLEFRIFDANKQLVQFKDQSQLYISIEIIT